MAAATTQDTDTIAAIATAAGFAGVGVVRLSGTRALEIGEAITGPGLQARRATLRSFHDPAGRLMDTGVVVYFAGPRSFTGEDVVELQGHGGPVVLQMTLEALVKSGARLARPGEFTERAYLNGKLDLAQAEAVADLIAGATAESVRGANRSLSGEFSERVHEIDRQVLALRTYVEAAIDFPDEDIDLLAEGQVVERVERILEMLETLRADCEQGVMLRDGIRLALIGAPNVGKSSVLNRLLGESRAIVTDIPGTTRDLVRADLNLAGLPVQLADTAGLRSATDAVEQEGVRRALEEAAGADLVLWIDSVDNQNKWSVESLQSNDCSVEGFLQRSADSVLKVLNKRDLLPNAVADGEAAVAVSALTGEGFETLTAAIRERVGFTPREGTFTARRRHLVALDRALECASRAGQLAAGAMAGELIAEELKLVHAGLGDIVGQVSSDELLGEIFSSFCIGK